MDRRLQSATNGECVCGLRLTDGPPGGFCFDVFDCGDEPVQSNPKVADYNLPRRVQEFIRAAKDQAGGTRGDVETMNIMWTVGSDFQYGLSNTAGQLCQQLAQTA
jgi:hypothetical protein